MITQVKLRTELSQIYEREDCSGSVALLNLIMEDNLQRTLSESIKPLHIQTIILMTISEVERCFSTLKRLKTCL